jgi:hypothetical protein
MKEAVKGLLFLFKNKYTNMKTLTKREVSVLASSIGKEINAPIIKSNEALSKKQKSDFIKSPEYKSVKGVLKYISTEAWGYLSVISSLRTVFDERTKGNYILSPIVMQSDIEDSIVLARIECEDLKEIKEAILKQFS